MNVASQKKALNRWSKLQVRMTFTYLWVTLIIVLFFEILVSTAFYLLLTKSPFLSAFALYRAQLAAQTYAYQASIQGGGTALDPRSTFQPGSPYSLTASLDGDSAAHVPSISFGALNQPGNIHSQQPGLVALLIDPKGTILASSDPNHYPVSMPVKQVLPGQMTQIDSALSGKPVHLIAGSSQDRFAFAIQPVMGKENQTIGAIYIQSPAGLNDSALFSGILSGWIRSALGWLILMLPFGILFGLVTSRGLVKRINRLVDATTRFANGEYSQRVSFSRPDEIGQLENQFNQMAEQLVESIAREKATSEQSARREERARIEQELRTAQYIQRSLLPEKVPSLEGWMFQPYYQPAREVGGDFYDFLALPDGQIGIVIADVTGKGIAAALVMATTCTMLRATTSRITSPGEVLARVNNLVHDHIPAGMFVTCFYAVLQPTTGRLRFSNAGHDIPYRLEHGDVCEVRAVGMPLGLMPDEQYEEKEIIVREGESILFYTDGLVEAHNPEREMYGFPRLKTMMQDGKGSKVMIESLLDDLQRFTGKGWEQEDDVTLVTLQRV